MNLRLLILIFFNILFISCSSQQTKTIDSYESALKKIPDSMVSYFPKHLSEIYYYRENFETANQCIYFANYVFDNKDSLLINKIQYLVKYNAADTSLVTIKNINYTDRYKTKRVIHTTLKKQDQTYYPILYLEPFDAAEQKVIGYNICSNSTPSGLTNDFDIYIIDSKPGKFWDGLAGVNYLPNEWKNGYSKGISINKNKSVIIYWIVIW